MTEPATPTTRNATIASAQGPGWTMVIPRGWSSLSTDPRLRQGQVRRLLDRRFAGVSRDEVASVRRAIAQALEDQLADAAAKGARQVHLQTQPMRGVPIAASLVVTVVENVHDRSFPAAVERALGSSEGVVEHGPSTAGPFASLRRVRRVRSTREGVSEDPGWETVVDHVVEVSSDELLVLTFATTTDQVSGPLVMLFDAIAGSLRPSGDRSGRSPAGPGSLG